MSEYRFFIPENLDIDKICEDNKEYMKTMKLRKPFLIYFLGQIAESRMLNTKKMNKVKTRFTSLCSSTLDIVVHNYNHYRDFLLSANITGQPWSKNLFRFWL